MLRVFLTYLFISTLFLSAIHAQPAAKDTAKKASVPHDFIKTRPHSPSTAMILSACVPGLGQAYNKKYWKIPLVYASMGATIYFLKSTDKLYRGYKQAYISKTDSIASTVDIYPDYSAEQIKELETYYRRYRDLNVILTALFYTINIVDAYVDAQFMNFDVSDNLSLNIAPALNFYSSDFRSSGTKQKPSAGLTLTFKF